MLGRNLDGQVALVTGGGSGIGKAVAVALAEMGVRCALVGRRADVLDEALGELATPGVAVPGDLTDHSSHAEILSRVGELLGPVDILVNSAGIFEKNTIQDTSDEFWDRVMTINLNAVMAFTRSVWPALQQTSGQILMVSSLATRSAFPGNSAYAASKAAMNALAEVLTLEGRGDGIRVITIGPGQTDTPIWTEMAPVEVRDAMMTSTAVGELTAALLASDRGMQIDPVFMKPMKDPWKEVKS